MIWLHLRDRLDQFFQIQETKMPELMIAELLVYIDEMFAGGDRIWAPGKSLLIIGEIRRQDVRYIEILGIHLEATGAGSYVMDMDVTAVPALLVQLRPAAEWQDQGTFGCPSQFTFFNQVLEAFDEPISERKVSGTY
jgi:hypothetical protein